MRARALAVLAVVVVLLSVQPVVAVASRLITGKDVKDGSLTGRDVRDGSLTGKDVKDGSLQVSDFPAGQLPAGPAGSAGPRGFSAWDAIPSGVTVIGPFFYDSTTNTANVDDYLPITLPGVASGPLQAADVNFAPDVRAVTTDDDPACTGTASAPTAPAGKVCLYVSTLSNVSSVQGLSVNAGNTVLEKRGFALEVAATADNVDVYLNGAWAYTAP